MDITKKYHLVSDIIIDNTFKTHKLVYEKLMKTKNPSCYIIVESIKKIYMYDFLTQLLVLKKMIQAQCKVYLFISDYSESNNQYTKCIKHLFSLFKIKDITIISLDNTIILDKYWTIFNNVSSQIDISDIHNDSFKKVLDLIDPIKLMAKIIYLNGDFVSLGVDRYNIANILKSLQIENPPILFSQLIPKNNEHIYILDDPKTIEKKILDFYCPFGEIKDNLIIRYYEHVLFLISTKITIEREDKYGGNIIYSSISALKNDYSNCRIHPLDLKKNLIKYILKIIDPIREDCTILKNMKLLNI